MQKISIRNAKNAIIGLQDMIDYINKKSKIDTKSMIMVEVGSYVGDSTRIFAENFFKVFSVDPYVNGYDDKDASSFTHPMEVIEQQFREEILNKYDNVHQFKMTSLAACKSFKDKMIFDFIYLDGDHTSRSVEQDVINWLQKIKLNGWLGGHDYGNKNALEVKPTIDKIIGVPEMIFKDTSWIKGVATCLKKLN